MEPILARTKFSKPAHEKAARTLVETGGGSFPHGRHGRARRRQVGAGAPLKLGQVFSIDPRLGCRRRPCICDTKTRSSSPTRGTRITDFLPMELDDMERLVSRRAWCEGAAHAGVRDPEAMIEPAVL